jgi:outer membrane murein-binding lipoprotein Lpp
MMSQARQQALLQGQTAQARKIFDVVPIGEQWTTNQLIAELARRGTTMQLNHVTGCLRTLVDAGLVTETSTPGAYLWQRVPVKEEKPKSRPAPAALVKSEAAGVYHLPVEEKLSPMARLEQIAVKVSQLGAQVAVLSNELADAIIDVQAQQEASRANLQKLAQLQALLKGIGNLDTIEA